MAIKDLISPGIGFTPGSPRYIITRGLSTGGAPPPPPPPPPPGSGFGVAGISIPEPFVGTSVTGPDGITTPYGVRRNVGAP